MARLGVRTGVQEGPHVKLRAIRALVGRSAEWATDFREFRSAQPDSHTHSRRKSNSNWRAREGSKAQCLFLGGLFARMFFFPRERGAEKVRGKCADPRVRGSRSPHRTCHAPLQGGRAGWGLLWRGAGSAFAVGTVHRHPTDDGRSSPQRGRGGDRPGAARLRSEGASRRRQSGCGGSTGVRAAVRWRRAGSSRRHEPAPKPHLCGSMRLEHVGSVCDVRVRAPRVCARVRACARLVAPAQTPIGD